MHDRSIAISRIVWKHSFISRLVMHVFSERGTRQKMESAVVPSPVQGLVSHTQVLRTHGAARYISHLSKKRSLWPGTPTHHLKTKTSAHALQNDTVMAATIPLWVMHSRTHAAVVRNNALSLCFVCIAGKCARCSALRFRRAGFSFRAKGKGP